MKQEQDMAYQQSLMADRAKVCKTIVWLYFNKMAIVFNKIVLVLIKYFSVLTVLQAEAKKAEEEEKRMQEIKEQVRRQEEDDAKRQEEQEKEVCFYSRYFFVY